MLDNKDRERTEQEHNSCLAKATLTQLQSAKKKLYNEVLLICHPKHKEKMDVVNLLADLQEMKQKFVNGTSLTEIERGQRFVITVPLAAITGLIAGIAGAGATVGVAYELGAFDTKSQPVELVPLDGHDELVRNAEEAVGLLAKGITNNTEKISKMKMLQNWMFSAKLTLQYMNDMSDHLRTVRYGKVEDIPLLIAGAQDYFLKNSQLHQQYQNYMSNTHLTRKISGGPSCDTAKLFILARTYIPTESNWTRVNFNSYVPVGQNIGNLTAWADIDAIDNKLKDYSSHQIVPQRLVTTRLINVTAHFLPDKSIMFLGFNSTISIQYCTNQPLEHKIILGGQKLKIPNECQLTSRLFNVSSLKVNSIKTKSTSSTNTGHLHFLIEDTVLTGEKPHLQQDIAKKVKGMQVGEEIFKHHWEKIQEIQRLHSTTGWTFKVLNIF